MITLEKTAYVHSESQPELQVARTDISFDSTRDKVRIQVTVHNEGVHRSSPTVMRLESAPLGAFVPWQPLTQLVVPPLEPGESCKLSTEVARPHPAPLGDFDRIPPKRLLTAVNSPDQPSPVGSGSDAMLRRMQKDRSSDKGRAGKTSLAPDFWDLAGHRQPHWAGNINVFVRNRAVERHRAQALRVYPGRTNLAMFMVGSLTKNEKFAFELVGLPPDWKAALYNSTRRGSLLVEPTDTPMEESQWVQSHGALMLMLAVQPPADCQTGNLEVHVTRDAPRATAIVEFNLDPAAQGPGCYFA